MKIKSIRDLNKLKREGEQQIFPKTIRIQVGTAPCGLSKGAKDVVTTLQKELEKANDSFMPRQYYIEKWGYQLGEGRHIPYYFEEDLRSADSINIEFQGPELNMKYRKE